MRPIILFSIYFATNLHAVDSKRSQVSGTTTKISHVQKYSFPPNNTPVSKVYVFGRPVYVRQPFVIPQRQDYLPRLDSQVLRDEKSFHGNADSLSGGVERTLVQESLVKQFFKETDPLHYQLPERPFPPRTGFSTTPSPPVVGKQKYPLPQCYTNDSGFMCCNPKLEQLIRDAFDDLSSDPKWQTCNVQQIANVLQNRSQSVFNTDFEALVGLGDFASKTHFFSDLICKIEVQGRFMLAYATPNRHYVRPAPYAVEPQTSTIGYV
ncbi:unnamed protein product [Cylicocyclus nassatus]|uniref:Ground-like domain-containing protein n=1 Tax=Cylicocyclus nassatus TaxID=53992 RepID=A0AA36HD85_CYLNA|nr:unnamed protein product [Cylicocyclus nassatus]